MCSFCNSSEGKFFHLNDSIRAPIDLHFEGHTNLQSVLEKILNKKGVNRKASNEICQKCRDKLHGIYSFTRQHTESEKNFHQITEVTVRLKKLKTFFILTDIKTEFEAFTETDKDVGLLKCSSTVTDIECDDSVDSKVVLKNEFGNNFEGTDFSKVTKDLSVGSLGKEYSNAADGRSVLQKKIHSISNADSEQITIEEEIVKEEWTMQEGEIFEAKSNHDVFYREQTKFSCDICDERFNTVSCLTKHTKMVHGNDSHEFNRRHLKTFPPITNYSCDQCGKKFKYKYNLKVHKQSHAGVVYKCDHCDATYRSKQGLNRHKKLSNGILFNCDQCDAKYKTNEGLRQHKISHTGVTISCNKCNASLSSKWSLRNHLREVHTDVVFSCDHCDAQYKSKRALNVHKLNYSGISFNCDQCDVKYKTNEGLRQHKVSHSDVTFPCNKCDASFSIKRYLRQHLRGVHPDALFSCDHCDATYKSKRCLNEHKRNINGISFNCDQCGRNFTRMRYLKHHKLSQHSNTESG